MSDITHSGTGRFGWIVMRPMSLFESGDSTGDVSLGSLFGSADISGSSHLDMDRLTFLICRGGWPASVDMQDRAALDQAFDYIDSVVRSDVSRTDGRFRDPQKLRKLLRSYARNQGSQISQSAISTDISANETSAISEETVS